MNSDHQIKMKNTPQKKFKNKIQRIQIHEALRNDYIEMNI